MKVLKGLEELKQMRNRAYRFILSCIIDTVWCVYGLAGLYELLDLIHRETE